MSMRWRESRSFGPGGGVPPVVKALLIANVAIYTFQLVAGTVAGTRLDQIFGLVPYDVTHHFFVWQLGTYMFLHGGLLHLGLNMLALWMFGSELEATWGSERFARFYFVTGVGAGICSVVTGWNSYIPIIGASGAIYGLLAAYGILFPDRTLLLYFIVPIKAKWFVLILGLITFWSSLSASGSGVAHVAHLGGMLFGWLYLRGWAKGSGLRIPSLKEWQESRRQAALRKKFKLYYRDTRGEDPNKDEE
ncbi:MAG TPA: rhomboid family intramembrane serine protease [Candidatus Eisenbacteria bacterium]|nr:rhomboid family intramembrane serine protease [Candidatus Eisenbacteria bacterium]